MGGAVAVAIPAISATLPPVIAGATLIGLVALKLENDRKKFSVECERVMKKTVEAVTEASRDAQKYHEDKRRISDASDALKDLLPICEMNRRKLADCALNPDQEPFAIAAADMVLEQLALQAPDQFGPALDLERKFASDVLRAAFTAAIENREYFKRFEPHLIMQQMRGISAIKQITSDNLSATKTGNKQILAAVADLGARFELNVAPELRHKLDQPILEEGATRKKLPYGSFALEPEEYGLPNWCLLAHGDELLFRDDTIASIKEAIGPGLIISFVGPAESGKTAIINGLIRSVVDAGEPRVSIFRLNLQKRRVERAMYNLLKDATRAVADVFEGGRIEELDDELEANAITAWEIVHTAIYDRLPIIVLEGAYATSAEQLQSLLSNGGAHAELFQSAVILNESRQSSVLALQAPFFTEIDVPVSPFSRDQADEYLQKHGVDRDILTSVFDIVVEDDSLLSVGLLKRTQLKARLHSARSKRSISSEVFFDLLSTSFVELASRDIAMMAQSSECEPTDIMEIVAALFLVGHVSIDSDLLVSHERLSSESRERIMEVLRNLAWLDPGRERLSTFGMGATRAILQSGALDEPRHADRIVSMIADAINEIAAQSMVSADALERALANILTTTKFPKSSLSPLYSNIIVESAQDQVQPFTSEDEHLIRDNLKSDEDLQSIIAKLVLASRATPNSIQKTAEDLSVEFFRAAKSLENLKLEVLQLTAIQIRAVDTAIFLARKNFAKLDGILRLRRKLFSNIAEPQPDIDESRLTVLASWVLNLSETEFQLGERRSAIASLEHAEKLIESANWPAESVSHCSLLRRVFMARGAYADNSHERVSSFENAYEQSLESVRLMPVEVRWVGYVFRSTRAILEELGTDQEREVRVQQTLQDIEGILGSRVSWPLAIRSQAAALLRKQATLAYSDVDKKSLLETALRALGEIDRDHPAAWRALLVEARILWNLDRGEHALSVCREAQNIETTLSGWNMIFNILGAPDADTAWRSQNGFDLDVRYFRGKQSFDTEVRKYKDWARANPSRGLQRGRLELKIEHHRVRAEGSILRAAINQNEEKGGRPFHTWPTDRKIKLLEKIAQERLQALKKIESYFGNFRQLYLARVKTIAQLEKQRAVYNGQAVDDVPVMSLLDEAEQIWRGSVRLSWARAGYFDRTWNFAAAAEQYEIVINSARDGSLRRRAEMALANCLYKQVRFERISPDDRQSALDQAQSIASNLKGISHSSSRAAILSEKIKLEQGDTINWTDLDDAYESVIGGIDGFPNKFLSDFDHYEAQDAEIMSDVEEAFLSNFTNGGVLSSYADLYARRAELNQGNRPLEYFKRAYSLLQAAAYMERSQLGSETPMNSLAKARVIILAAKETQNENPISGLRSGKVDNQLLMSRNLLSRAASNAAGEFRLQIADWVTQWEKVREQLK